MERIWGKKSLSLTTYELHNQMAAYSHCLIDIGTGDGRFVQHTARQRSEWFCIGIDACRENLVKTSRKGMDNALFLIACAQDLPAAFDNRAHRITINFPWGSLLKSLLAGDPALLDGLVSLVQKECSLEIRLNGGALTEAGWSLETGAWQVYQNLRWDGWKLKAPARQGEQDLQGFPSTWAKRLAFGRDPRAMLITGQHRSVTREDILVGPELSTGLRRKILSRSNR
jgi:16S rRNA (adenine(1408)-N(1))-methyltransferase